MNSTDVATLKVCAWCSREKSDDELTTGRIVPDELQRDASHGICAACAQKVLARWVAWRRL